jgi:hypothetical protein
MTAAHTEPRDVRPPLTRHEARALTDSIRRSVERTWSQLEEAHERRAWVALDFPSWESYIVAEFGIRRSRSYQLLNQAKVIHEIADAAGVHNVDITEATARDIKPRLAEVVEEVRDAVEDVPEDERPSVVADVVSEARARFIADRDTGEVLSPDEWRQANPSIQPVESDPASTAVTPPPAPDDGWSPSDALERRPRPRSSGPRPAPATPRPSTIEQSFDAAAVELRKAVDRVERLSADPRFASAAQKIGDKHGEGIAYALEGLGLVRIRLRKQAR